MKPASNKLMQINRIALSAMAVLGYLCVSLLEIYKTGSFTLASTWPVLAYAIVRAVFNIEDTEIRKGADKPPII